ncbi:TolC family protein [Rickettsiales endosymbiont of Stachyamoeba lipophora]|uniref:TolC family protein n=1 Tax=Rickettsiales endosymbiont of Stachyamoeba lipophora TaxID=2486578 RepID=UPI000F65105E|nr:TolC family protein [Rickettsiales endosymbiont of Stachyamoeba lipophora]AZL15712.1 hypothetical protein EF513_04010 [Rickettsiales endosymbiont of Stachyamoeba lipophora]
MKKILLISLFSFVIPSFSHAAEFKDALIKAYEKANDYKFQKDQHKSLKARNVKAFLGFAPSINAEGSRTYYKNKNVDDIQRSEEYTSRNITIRQNIFNGGRTFANLKKSGEALTQGGDRLKQAEGSVLYNAASSYLEVLLSQEVKKQVSIKLETLQKFYESINLRFKLGEVTATDVSQAKARLSLAEAEMIAANARLDNAANNYIKLIGDTPADLKPINFEINVPSSVEEALRIADKHNHEMRMANSDVKLAQQDANAAVGRLLPIMDVVGKVDKISGSFSTQRKLNKSVVVDIQVPIFNQGAEYADIFDTQYQKSAQKYRYQKIYEDNIENVKRAWTKFNSLSSQIIAAEDAVESARLAFEGTMEEAKIGLKTNIDVLNAEQELYEARIKLLNNKYQKILAALEMVNVIGKLDVNFIKTNNL